MSNNKLLNGLKIRMMFPFYVDQIHHSFFNANTYQIDGIEPRFVIRKN